MVENVTRKLAAMVADMRRSTGDHNLVIVCPEGTFNRIYKEVGASSRPDEIARKREALLSFLDEKYHDVLTEPTSGLLMNVPIVEVKGVKHFAVIALDALSVTSVKESTFLNLQSSPDDSEQKEAPDENGKVVHRKKDGLESLYKSCHMSVSEDLFYIQCHGTFDDMVYWLSRDGSGFSVNLDESSAFTEKEVWSRNKHARSIYWPKGYIDSLIEVYGLESYVKHMDRLMARVTRTYSENEHYYISTGSHCGRMLWCSVDDGHYTDDLTEASIFIYDRAVEHVWGNEESGSWQLFAKDYVDRLVVERGMVFVSDLDMSEGIEAFKDQKRR